MAIHFHLFTLVSLLLSYFLVVRKTNSLNPVFGVFVVFATLYLFVGELYFVKADNFSPEVYLKTSQINFSCAVAVLLSVLAWGRREEKDGTYRIDNLSWFWLG